MRQNRQAPEYLNIRMKHVERTPTYLQWVQTPNPLAG